MTGMDTEKRHSVLCVDDEKSILSALARLLRRENYNLLTADNIQDGFQILGSRDIHLVISDHRMPGMSGITFLSGVREKWPDTIRILLTGYTEIESIMESVNKGHIYKFLLKPWNDDNLKMEIRKSLEQYDLIQANRTLTMAVEKKNRELARINNNQEQTIKKRTRELELQNQALELTRTIFEGLPVPVLGISCDGTIILINRQARNLRIDGVPLMVGLPVNDVFPGSFLEKIAPVFHSKNSQVCFPHKIGGQPHTVTFSSLTGRFADKGFILCLQSQEV